MTFEPSPQDVTLRDGARVTIRLAEPADAPRLVAMHRRLSRRTLFMRYLSASKRLTLDEARQICDPADETRLALVAALADSPESLVGLAFCALPDPVRPDLAEAAIVVEDARQGQGLGRAMLWRLGIASWHRGITTLTACVHCQNEPITHFVRDSGLRIEQAISGSQCEFIVHLDGALLAHGPLDPSSV